MASKLFEMADQERFAQVSGDWNPMHMDALAARRTQMGAPVVHGMHTVLVCLEAFAQSQKECPAFSDITVNFMKPIYVGEEVHFSITSSAPLRLAAEVKGTKVMTLELSPGVSVQARSSAPSAAPAPQSPKELSFSEIEKLVGQTRKMPNNSSAANLFPKASRWIGTSEVGTLAILSTLVGMECPGLHSIFIGFKLSRAESPANELDYSILTVDDRFQRIKMGVRSGGWAGSVEASMRKPPISQVSLQAIAAQVKPGSFKDQRVLIIGGSRGIGEYTAKVIAAGGGEVAITYAVGKKESEELQKEIQAFGGRAVSFAYDARMAAGPQLGNLPWAPTHVYYFATGRIFGKKGTDFDPVLLEEFRRFYVEGFRDLCAALRERTEKFSVFYPSSVAVLPEERPKSLVEYAMAKEEGEALCANLEETLPGVRVIVKRLPRLPTDQTATVMPVPGEASMDSFLPLIMEMQG